MSTAACRGDYKARLGLMVRGLAALAPDIILLQDVFATSEGRYNTAAAVARGVGMAMAFHPARPAERHLDGRPIACHAGIAVLTRMPIRGSLRIDLARDAESGEHIAQMVDVTCGDDRLLVVNAQLSAADSLRRRQIEQIGAALEGLHGFDHSLVGGDFGAADGEGGRDRISIARPPGGFRPVHAEPVLEQRDPITGLTVAERPAALAQVFLGAAHLIQAAE